MKHCNKSRIRFLVAAVCLVSLVAGGTFTGAALGADETIIEKEAYYHEEGFVEDMTADRLYEYMLYLARADEDPAEGEAQLFSINGSSAGSQLTGVEKKVYDALEAKIIQIANGEEQKTSFSFTFDQLGIEKPWYTAEELGVPALIEDGSISADAVEALCNTISLDTSSVIHALMADHPYEMYWYDKTQGCYINFRYGGRVQYGTDGTVRISLSQRSSLSVSLYVAKAYAGSNANTVGLESISKYKVPAAVEEAKSVVAANANKTDYEKLVAYKQYISDAVEYDDAAANENNSTPYGNPWQLISVFDKDPETNVVCEGYSKAFQFLCDLSKFSGSIHCYSVTGILDLGTDSGAHMWNIVHMEDGSNYLADLTNCDTSTIGYPDFLFLKGVESGNRNSIDYTAIIPERREAGVLYREDQVSYVYDQSAKNLWGDAGVLRLAKGSYEPAATSLGAPRTAFGIGTVTPTISGRTVSVSVPLSNTTSSSQSMTVFAAIYSSAGKLVGLQNVTLTVEPGGAEVSLDGISVPSSGTYTLKCMVSDASGLAPLSGSSVMTVTL